jgi:ferredoxin
MAIGYPATQSGIEIKILKRLFTEAEEELFLGLSPLLETPADAAKRLNRNPDEMVDEISTVDLNRCIGCGLCVTTCPSEAMQLVQKPEDQQYLPPETGVETYIRIAQERQRNPMPD